MNSNKKDVYQWFRSTIPQQRISIGSVNEKVWKFYDYGPKDITPLVFISSGTSEIHYKQFVSLCPKGYRCISIQFSPYDTIQGWCRGFDRFLDRLELDKVHLFGSSLGGYLAQCYYQQKPSRVLSMILNNTFSDTQYYHDNSSCSAMFSILPEFMLKRIILSNFPQGLLDADIAETVDFMVDQIENLSQEELASRLTLNCSPSGVINPSVGLENITIIDSLDATSVPERLREEVYKYYPQAKIALLKTGGDFCYISRSDELNVHIQVHLRQYGLDPVNNISNSNNNNSNSNSSNGDGNHSFEIESKGKSIKESDIIQ
ncbi:hypothetical protein CYY_004420 [Polysphondylium violaceum]|uniref:Maspardin n=1 Tax=Polysphondylium violaceum TaxID=133409 RepID=A0A8J4PV78_9MYCE|nr:hypothetical protein CYY_004420 [Polysphondylium violaceum]